MYLNGTGMRRISTILKSRGVLNHFGNPIDNRGIEYILNNPCYNGYLRWNPNGRSASARIYNNPDDILIKGDHEKIIDDDTFERVKELFDERRRANRKHSREGSGTHMFMLKGLVKCSNCGATLVYQGAYGSIQCNKYSRGACEVSHNISLKNINGMVITELEKAVEELNFNIASCSETKVKAEINYDQLIAAERLRLERAKQAYQSGVDSLEEYRTSKQRIEKEIKRLSDEKIKSLEKSGAFNTKEFSKIVTDVIAILKSPEISEEAKNKALKTIIQKIVYYNPGKKIELYFYT